MSKKHNRWLAEAEKIASKAEVCGGTRIGAVLVYKNRIIGSGNNRYKSHPLALKWGKNSQSIFIHAELDAILNAVRENNDINWKKTTLYVCRITKAGIRAMTKPCQGCSAAIAHFGIGNIVYSADENSYQIADHEEMEEVAMNKVLEIRVNIRNGDQDSINNFHENWADYTISVTEPEVRPVSLSGRHLNIQFKDRTDNQISSPKMEHIDAILDFVESMRDCQNLLIHCPDGIGRSTAISIGIMAAFGYSPEEAVIRTCKVRPNMWPNDLIVSLFDQKLKMNGKLITEVNNWKRENYNMINQ